MTRKQEDQMQRIRQEQEVIAVLKEFQHATGYVPTVEEFGELLRCQCADDAKKVLEEMLAVEQARS